MRINDSYHLSYCTNIHPGSNWESTFSSLKTYVPRIKKEVSPNEAFGLGLRLSNKASEELNQGQNFIEFKDWLTENELYVFTMNGFPYGNFHDERVKDKVHAPDWTTRERLFYTKRLFEQLSELLPSGMSGGISTSPISYKHWHKSEKEKHIAFETAAEHLIEVVLQLVPLELETEKYLHLDIEPEPDGLIENSEELIFFFEKYLIPVGINILMKKLGLDAENAEKLIKRHITVCYDICHFSLAFEEPEHTFKKFRDQGIQVGKIQVSAALKVVYDKKNMDEVWAALSQFDEPTYLHQVTQRVGDKVKTYNDLPIILESKNDFVELRAHFHVPIFLEQFGALFSTQDHILKVVNYLKQNQVSEHLEIETYTWDVLPQDLKRDLSESIVRELHWLKERL
jgi:hypothetical protein